EIELNATVDGQVKTITEASVRRYIKLADADGISSLPTTEIFKQLDLMSNMKRESRGFSRMEITLFPTMLVTELVSQGEGPTSPVGTQHTPTIIESSPHLQNISITYRKTKTKTGRMGIRIPPSNVPSSVADEAITKEMHDRLGRATATASSFVTEQGSEKQLKHKGKRAVIDSSDNAKPSLDAEDSPKQGRMIEELDKDENVNLVKSSEQGEAEETTGHRMEFSTASPQTVDDETLAETLLNIKRKLAKETARQEPKKYNLEKALELQKQLDERKKDKGDQAHDIDWSDPSVLRYHALQNRPFSKAKVRKNMCTYLKNQGGYKQSYFKRLRTISSGLVQIPYFLTPYVPPTKNDWDMLFQPMFDEYFNSPQSVVSPVPIAAAPRPVNPTGTPLSTSIEQDAPSAITSSTT
nr:hypothetical protein [Tanacetum cinerariifolium]